MGVGTPSNIIEAVARGVDFFDCVMPARNARHGHIFTSQGIMNLNNAKYIRDPKPIDENCNCPVCRTYSRAYLRHLFKAEEILAMRFYQGKTQMEVSAQIGISQAQVSRIEKGAIDSIKREL